MVSASLSDELLSCQAACFEWNLPKCFNCKFVFPHTGRPSLLLLVRNSSSVHCTSGDAVAHYFAAKDIRWVHWGSSGHVLDCPGRVSWIFQTLVLTPRWILLGDLPRREFAVSVKWELEPRRGGTRRDAGLSNGGPAVGCSRGAEDCFLPLAFSRAPILLHLVDCRMPVLHLSLRPLLPPVSDGCIASGMACSTELCDTRLWNIPRFLQPYKLDSSLSGFLRGHDILTWPIHKQEQ